jgi:hypothetical protein
MIRHEPPPGLDRGGCRCSGGGRQAAPTPRSVPWKGVQADSRYYRLGMLASVIVLLAIAVFLAMR